MKKFSEARKKLLNKKGRSSPIVRISKDVFEQLEITAYGLGLETPEAVKLAIKNWLTLTPSQALGISKEELYRMAELDGVKIGA